MRTSLEPEYLAQTITGQTGLEFEAETGVNADGEQWYVLRPRGLLSDYTFGIRTTLQWRRLRIDFEPGKFAASLLEDMGNAEAEGRSAFLAVLADSRRHGSQVDLEINGVRFEFDDENVWSQSWNRLLFSMNKGQLELGTDEGEPDAQIVCRWTIRFSAAVVAILPTEEVIENKEPEVIGYPEGSVVTVKANRYERDKRNRAAAIAIHGTACKGCGLEMDMRYGPIASGYVEIHHITPVSELGAEYIIDPARDLVPLCPNCHAVVHRRIPPLTVSELRVLIAKA